MTAPIRPNDILVADRIYIPTRFLSAKAVRKAYEKRVFDDRKCRGCQIFKDGERYTHEVCGPCPAHKGFFRTWSQVRLNGVDYVAVPSGNPTAVGVNLGIQFSDFKVHDLRADVKARFPLTFTGKLYDGSIVNDVVTVDQRKVLQKFTRYNRGMLLARARSGKTVMAVRLTCYLQRRTVVIAHEMELLKQFYERLKENTNLLALERRLGRRIAGIVETPAQLRQAHREQWDIVLVTYQRFIKEKTGLAQLNAFIRGKFGVAIVDEAHRGNAASYAAILGKIDPKFKIGLTATRERKDKMEFLMDQILGPVVAEANSIGMSPVVTVHETPFSMDYEPRGMTAYNKITRAMAEDQQRNGYLVKALFADLRANPKNCVVIPCLYVEHVHRLVSMINRYAQYLNDQHGENWSHNLAQAYHAKTNKDAVMKIAREARETRVTVAIRQKVADGIDVPPWNIMFLAFPMNNFTNFYQMTQRILTPMPGKPQPLLRFFVDNVGLSIGCLNASWYNGVVKYKYKFSPQTQAKVDEMARRKKTKASGKGRKGTKMAGRIGTSW